MQCPGVTAGSSSPSTAMPRVPRQPFAMCPRRETPANSKDTPVQLYKITPRGRGWGNEEQPCVLPRTGLGLHSSAEGLFSFVRGWIVAMGAVRENMTQCGSSVAHSVAGPLARAPARTRRTSLKVSFFLQPLPLPPLFPLPRCF